MQSYTTAAEFECYGSNPQELMADAIRQGAKFFNAYYQNGEPDLTSMNIVMGVAQPETETDTPAGREITTWRATARVTNK